MPVAKPADFVAQAPAASEALAEAYAGELETYRLRQSAQAQSESVLVAQMSQREAESQELKSQAGDLQKEAALQEKQVRMIEPMVRSGAAAEGVLLQKRADLQRIRSALNQARARLRQASEDLSADTGGRLLPAVDANLSGTRQKVDPSAYGVPVTEQPAPFTLYNASIDVSYTLDVFGGNRRALEGLAAQVLSLIHI